MTTKMIGGEVMAGDIKKTIIHAAKQLEQNYKEQGIFEVSVGEKMPKRSEIIELINEVRRIVFPGYFGT